LQALSVAWAVVEAAGSLGVGVATGSLLLVAFGIDGGIELVSAGVVFWRLWREARGRPDESEAIERLEPRAARVGGYLLYGLAVYIVAQSAFGLVREHTAETSAWGIAIAAIAALAMPLLAWAKLRVAARLGSRTLRADAVETLTCGYMA
jgi:divalent metal cation (Fe/Co/Zn/Cd) transporter